jgi:hypothetical protein
MCRITAATDTAPFLNYTVSVVIYVLEIICLLVTLVKLNLQSRLENLNLKLAPEIGNVKCTSIRQLPLTAMTLMTAWQM